METELHSNDRSIVRERDTDRPYGVLFRFSFRSKMSALKNVTQVQLAVRHTITENMLGSVCAVLVRIMCSTLGAGYMRTYADKMGLSESRVACILK